MRCDYVNPKKKIRRHLRKRKTSYTGLYAIFVFAIVAVGIIGMLLKSDFQSEASEIAISENTENILLEEVLNEKPLAIEIVKEALSKTIELENNENSLFAPTIKESLLKEMLKKENIELTMREELFFETH